MQSTQAIFNQVVIHLLTQREQSIVDHPDGSGKTCAYRGENGLMCAVGCLITDSAYASIGAARIENKMVGSHEVIHALQLSLGTECIISEYPGLLTLLEKLQTVHDWTSVSAWKEDLMRIAAHYDFSTDVFKQFQ